MWAFWLACVLAVVAAITPLVFGGGSSRLGGALLPFAIAAIALAACALLYTQGRPVTTGLYFVASLAIVYGILSMIAVPLRLAVLGTCSPEPAPCAAGLERPLTNGESTALGFGIGIGIVAILTGFFGLVTLYRRHTVAAPTAPPTRRIAAVGEKAAPTVAEAAPAQAPPSPPVTTPEPGPEPEPELPAHASDLELAAPAEPLELPAVGSEDPAEAAPPAPPRKPRKRRPPKPPPDAPTTPSTEATA